MFIKFMQISFIKLLYEEENDMKNNKGITLVALVVTIVVLLILAGVSINLVLGNNGIIAKAKEAETKSAEASQNDLKGMNGLVSEMEGALAGNGSTGSGSGNGNTGSGNNFVTKNTEVTYPDGKVWIPEGFKVADDSASTVQGGVVIEDKDRNQFVWVPVATLADYKRTAYSTNVATEETDTATNSIKINYSSSKNSEYFTEALPEDEKTSVERYKGFYIGRYEAGDKENTEAKTLRSSNDVTKTVTIKANQAPYNNVTKTQAISLAEGFATKQGYKAKTKLVSSYAWDTTIAFLKKVNSDYGNSSEEGNYRDTTFSYTDITGASKTKEKNSSVLVPTGQTTPVCNIYDMGGNVWAWTTESCSRTDYPYAKRGGYCNDLFAGYPAGYRDDGSVNAYVYNGFRLTLFM
jgi:formylglycine-generating enzyme required for sulfatase activity